MLFVMTSESSELKMEEVLVTLQQVSHSTIYEYITRHAVGNQFWLAQNMEAFLFQLHDSYLKFWIICQRIMEQILWNGRYEAC
jgi:predicted DNA-binding transcriptional regulator AlpA